MSGDTVVIFEIGAATFFFMGLGLAGDAKHHAEAAADWEKLALGVQGKRDSRGLKKRLTWAYRAGGLAFCAAGLAAAVAARWFPAAVPARFQAVSLDPAGRSLSGLLFISIALLLSSFKAAELAKPSRLPGRLADAMSEERADWGRRLASLSGWLVLTCFMGLGVYLLSHRA